MNNKCLETFAASKLTAITMSLATLAIFMVTIGEAVLGQSVSWSPTIILSVGSIGLWAAHYHRYHDYILGH